MNILKRFTLKYLKLNRHRTIVTIVGVFLSCALLCGTALLAASFRDLGIRGQIAASGNYHVTFNKVSYSKVKYLLSNDETKTGMLKKDCGYATVPKLKNPYVPYIHVDAYDSSMLRNQPLKLMSGRLPKCPGEIVISEGLLRDKAANYKTGDRITLNLGSRTLDGRICMDSPFEDGEKLTGLNAEDFKITGIIKQPSYISNMTPAYEAVTYLDPSALSASDAVDVWLLVKHPVSVFKNAPAMAKEAGLKFSGGGESGRDILYNSMLLAFLGARGGETYGGSYTTVMTVIFLIIFLIIFIGSITVIYNSFAISVNERKKQFGMLSSIGATSGQIKSCVGYEAFIVGAIGIPAGLIGGTLGIAVVISVAGRMLKQLLAIQDVALRLVPLPLAYIFTIVLAALTIFVSAAVPAHRAAKVTPIDAIRQTGEFNVKKRTLHTGKFTRKLFGFEGELALKNLKRNRKRYRATVVSLCISIIMFLSFSSFMALSLQEAAAEAPPRYDLTINLKNNGNTDYREFIKQAESLPGIKSSRAVRTMWAAYSTGPNGLGKDLRSNKKLLTQLLSNPKANKYNLTVNIMAIGDRAFGKYLDSLGLNKRNYENASSPMGIFVNRDVTELSDSTHKASKYQYDFLDISKGQSVRVNEADLKGKAFADIKVGAVDNANETADVHDRPSSMEYIYVSDRTFDSIAAELGKGSVDGTTKLEIQTQNAKSNKEVVSKIKNIYSGMFSGPMNYYNMYENARKVNIMIWLVEFFCYCFIAIITLIGVTSIINTINTNINLRKREFAVLKSVGLTPGGFSKMLRFESLFYGLKALAFGIPISAVIYFLLYKLFIKGINNTLKLVIPWGALIGCIAGVFAIVFLTMLYAGSKSKNDNIIDAIKGENL